LNPVRIQKGPCAPVSNWHVSTREGLPPTAESRNFILSHHDQCAGFKALMLLWSIIFRRPQVIVANPPLRRLKNTRRLGFDSGVWSVPVGVFIPINTGEPLPIAARIILHPFTIVFEIICSEVPHTFATQPGSSPADHASVKSIRDVVLAARPETDTEYGRQPHHPV